MSKRLAKNLLLFLLCAAAFFCILAIGEAQAQGFGARTVLENSKEANQFGELAVEKMWTAIFVDSNVLYQSVSAVATGFLGVFFLLTILPILNDAGNFNWRGVGARFAWIILVAVLLFNDASMLRKVTSGAHTISNQVSSYILDIQLNDVTMREAIRDTALSDEAIQTISEKLADCEAKEGRDQLTCFEEGSILALEEINNVPAADRNLDGVRRVIENLQEQISRLQDAREAKGKDRFLSPQEIGAALGAVTFQGSSQAASNALLKNLQQAFVYGTEISLLLTGVVAPLAVAASLIPVSPRAIYVLFIAFLGLCFMKLTYNILVGFCATWVVLAERQGQGDYTALLLMSVASPLIAMGLTTWGGSAILTGLARGASTGASLIPVPAVAVGK